MEQPDVKCTKCGWIGSQDQQILIASESLKEMGVKGFDHVCPRCGNNEFFEDAKEVPC